MKPLHDAPNKCSACQQGDMIRHLYQYTAHTFINNQKKHKKNNRIWVLYDAPLNCMLY